MHGDHVFGLPGVFCYINNSRAVMAAGGGGIDQPPLHIYGPPGLAEFVRSALTLSHTGLCLPVVVHELAPRLAPPASAPLPSPAATSLRPAQARGGAGGAAGALAGHSQTQPPLLVLNRQSSLFKAL